ncbi:hypothetical protein QFZ23_001341 [Arthrobacter globiformis]|uniref:hypothetical protein n=1 Tax=Arthrobacter globiformis TaxID=1665 RepID=UPI002784CF5F|nr:hypothetical protein [Arthrobacter globiformis]MDQ1057440.1 hypothetical protein [Arthrobacter globiformis]
MDDSPETRQRLSESIEEKQSALHSYLERLRPRRHKLTEFSVVGSVLAALFTAGPAFGGTGFTAAVQGMFSLDDASVVWRALCLGAVILSVGAGLATNFANSQAVAEKVTAAETAIAQLEGLQLSLGFGHIAIDEAAMLYKQFVSHVAFVTEVPSR